jgi:glutathione peroxidase
VNFELFDLINVNPPDEHPIFTWFKSQDGYAGDVQWNFEKILLSRDAAWSDGGHPPCCRPPAT